jgi:ATP-dependent RNA helicase DDX49/DBP8
MLSLSRSDRSELAYQLAEQFIVLGKPLGLTTSTIVGGMDMMKQARELCSKPHIVVATPGRLVDLLRSSAHGQWDLGRVKTLVLDEADRLLTPTFAPDLGFLFQNLPEDRQTCLFTATISEEIEKLVARPPRKGKMRPFVHRVESETLTVKGLKQSYLFLPGHARDPYLYYLLTHPPKSIAHLRHKKAVDREMERERESSNNNNKKRKHHEGRGVEELNEEGVKVEDIPSTIIFTQRCATAHLLHLILTELDIPSVALHSHLSQPQRLLSLAQFRAGQVPVLVTTDVGSRGLDIPEVAMVVNFDCPRTGEDYVHRVGRTARAGRGGLAVTIVTERDVDLVKGIEEMTSASSPLGMNLIDVIS